MTTEPIAAPTDFETRVSDAADAIINAGISGYQWEPVDALLREELGAELGADGVTRCKQAKGSGRAANVLTESNDKEVALYVVFVRAPYTTEKFRRAAANRISRFPNVRTVAIAEKVFGTWRVTHIVERDGIGLATRVADHFALVEDSEIEIVPASGLDLTPVAEVERLDEEIFASASSGRPTVTTGLADLPMQFREFARDNSVALDATTAIDALACALSSQLLLFAGPSGTGKSTLARLLAGFLTGPDNWRVLEARRGWGSPEDAVGYYSTLSERFAHTPDTWVLTDLHEACGVALSEQAATAVSAPIPLLLVEEVNLSPIEGYLAPVVHGLSRPATPYLRWQLHAQREGAADMDEALTLPPDLLLGPWPRIFGTINVDANSPAPARKISARSVVILLEPDADFDVAREVERLKSDQPTALPKGNNVGDRVGEPTTARAALNEGDLKSLVTSFGSVLASAGGSDLVPSRRDVDRALNYMAYYVALASSEQAPADAMRRAAENAILHVVLPQLSAETFASAIRALASAHLEDAAADPGVIGGLLGPRVTRLGKSMNDALFADAVDFWTALS